MYSQRLGGERTTGGLIDATALHAGPWASRRHARERLADQPVATPEGVWGRSAACATEESAARTQHEELAKKHANTLVSIVAAAAAIEEIAALLTRCAAFEFGGGRRRGRVYADADKEYVGADHKPVIAGAVGCSSAHVTSARVCQHVFGRQQSAEIPQITGRRRYVVCAGPWEQVQAASPLAHRAWMHPCQWARQRSCVNANEASRGRTAKDLIAAATLPASSALTEYKWPLIVAGQIHVTCEAICTAAARLTLCATVDTELNEFTCCGCGQKCQVDAHQHRESRRGLHACGPPCVQHVRSDGCLICEGCWLWRCGVLGW